MLAWQYLGLLLVKAFSPAMRVTDALQAIIASALPAVGLLLGWTFTDNANATAFAYVGAAVVALIGIRLLWAPYSLWKEQQASIEALQGELARPERMVIEHLAKYHARDRRRAIKHVHTMMYQAHFKHEGKKARIEKAFRAAQRAAMSANLPLDCSRYLVRYQVFCISYDADTDDGAEAIAIGDNLIQYLTGSLTIEQLNARLPDAILLPVDMADDAATS